MKRVRVIPTLLLKDGGLVKGAKFKDHKYVGDPINAVKIFNDKEVDELILLDLSARASGQGPNLAAITEIAGEAFMPLGYGGGITRLEEVKKLIAAGVEKVILNTSAFENPQLIREVADYAGSQSVVVSIDVKKNIWGKNKVFVQNGSRNTQQDPVTYARQAAAAGAGELMLMNIDREGSFSGYERTLLQEVCAAVDIPVIAAGGAGSLGDFAQAIQAGASAVAAGSFFVFQRPHNAVLISYPAYTDLVEQVFKSLS